MNSSINKETIWQILETVCDPEVPVLTITDLGIVRDVEIIEDAIRISITPTYTGCPAMDMIAMNIRLALIENGYQNIIIKNVISPAWTTDWMTESGKQKLLEYGIAPPKGNAGDIAKDGVECPQCKSKSTLLISEFGSTACKALYKCEDCKEPFDYFKCY
ncbi:MAG: phenylacetate-CoA oxygenase subunit PaaJ [Chitinophagaceae bacterium]|nr:phenylacetate-CoA oxygenase subunit PaaJ [Chitinophagaceae bacterium]